MNTNTLIKQGQLEVFDDLIRELEHNDLELVELSVIDKDATDKLDCINQLVFRKFNEKITDKEIETIVMKYNDPFEFATFKIVYIEDVVIVYAYI